MSKEDYDLVRDLRSKIGLPLALCGCVLNAFAVIVYARMPINFVNRFLIGLQVLDTLFLLCTLYPFFVILIHGPNGGQTKSYQYYAKYVNNYLYVSFQRANVFCTAILSVNRCIVMLAPFNQFVKRLFKHPIRILVTTQTITLVTSIYSIFKTRVIHVKTSSGSEQYILTNTDAYKSHVELFDNSRLLNSFVFTYIPAIGSFIANVCMIVGLFMVSRKNANSDDPENKKFFRLGNQKTLVVLVYSAISLLLLIPFMSVSILVRVVPGFGPLQKEHYMFTSMGSIVALCDITRSTMGFFVFLGLSRVFRETFVAFILRRNPDKHSQGAAKATLTTSKSRLTVS